MLLEKGGLYGFYMVLSICFSEFFFIFSICIMSCLFDNAEKVNCISVMISLAILIIMCSG